jgi:glycosyltransferase involved in cell wall biosynthesis
VDANASKAEWAKVLTNVIKNKPLIRKMGENLHQITEEYFDLNKVARQRIQLYKDAFELRGYPELLKKLEAFDG